jgi:tetratricopeptide (TPR) repeat protein
MKKTTQILFLIAGLVIFATISGSFYLFNKEKQVTEQQAIASLDQGIALFREKKYAESLEILQSIPDGVIDDWHLPYYTATALVMLKDYQPAALKLEEALVLNPQETAILFELGVVYFKLGNLGLSKGYFAAVIEIDPGNEEAKGLMDIMANLERIQPGASQENTAGDDDTGVEGH